MNRSRFSSTRVLVLILCAGAVTQAQDDAAIVRDFQHRVKQYEAMKSEQGVPAKATNSAEKLAEQKRQAEQKVQAARPAAKRGDIFTPEIAAFFRKQIQTTLRGPGGRKVKASLQHAEPLPDVHLEVNAPYPRDLPLQSTPPTLLLNLPLLPKGLQYRIVGSALILYDETSRLVVDLIPGAIA